MAGNKTKPTEVDPAAFIAAVDDANRRADAVALAATMTRISGETPVMWGPSIVGFGLRSYIYDSGRSGEICTIGFAPRKNALVLYLACDLDKYQDALERLGKHQRGRGCLYVKRLSDVDPTVLDELIATAWDSRRSSSAI